MKCGVVDVGSNTIRLSVYRWETDGSIKLLTNRKVTAGLAGYIQDGAMSDGGLQAACGALTQFRALLDNFEIPDMYAFGTAPLRNITNTEEALAVIEARTGVRVEVLSGTEEAALSFRGASMGGGTPDGLLADIGGGSTELVSCRGEEAASGCSLPLGSLSLFSRFVGGLFPTKEERRAMKAAVRDALKRAKGEIAPHRHLTGVGGTVRAAAKLCSGPSEPGRNSAPIPAEDIRRLYKDLRKGDRDALNRILRACPDRVHTLLPGLVILTAVIDACEVETVSVSACGVREGYLMDRIVLLPN